MFYFKYSVLKQLGRFRFTYVFNKADTHARE